MSGVYFGWCVPQIFMLLDFWENKVLEPCHFPSFNILSFANLLAADSFFYLVFGDKSYFCLFSADRMSVALRHSVHVLCHYCQQGNGPLELVHYMSGE